MLTSWSAAELGRSTACITPYTAEKQEVRMEYIVSRPFSLPTSPDELAGRLWFNLWRNKLWPYERLVPGDTLYWYETKKAQIVWQSEVSSVNRFRYENKRVVQERLRLDDTEMVQPYVVSAHESGYCLAWEVHPMQALSLPKPADFQFQRNGWVEVDEDIAQEWLKHAKVKDDVMLDTLVPHRELLDQVQQLNIVMAEIAPERVRSIVAQTLRHDTAMVRAFKELCQYRCQFPACGIRIPKRDGGFYIEVAHVRPVHTGGQSVLGNLLVLCPNHHKAFDYGDVKITEQTIDRIRGTLNGQVFDIQLPLSSAV